MQYVRDRIENWYRIVAVVSLPQTAFIATGAGVKSSVLFLRKYSAKQTQGIEQLKFSLQNSVLNQHDYGKKAAQIEKEKQDILKNATGATYSGNLSEFKKTDEYKTWRSEVSAQYTEKLNDLKEELEAAYQQSKQSQLSDYPIFMAIAEDIGYDATGKSTGINELDAIGSELARFILEVNNGRV
jgi:type I restriction enzyme M protein